MILNKHKIFQLISILCIISFSYSYSIERKIGDVLQIALPVTAITTTYYMDDINGTKSFFKSYLATASTTYLLKITTRRLRPDGSNYMSFPSGHTSAAFSGASFIHFRYGFKYSVPLYLLASYTGYSRIYAEKHYLGDVIAGASLAIFSSWYFTPKYTKDYSFNLYYNPISKTIGINIYKFSF